MKYVGIKSCEEKRKALKKKGIIATVFVNDLYGKDCERHLEYLYKRRNPYKDYYREQGRTNTWIRKKQREYSYLLESIMLTGYHPEKHGYITVSENGARLDGSHRVAILKWIGVKKVDVKVVPMKMTKDLEKHLEEQRAKFG